MISNKDVKAYILLALDIIMGLILLLPLSWIANHVPDGIIGLIIFVGYIVLDGVLFFYLLYKIVA